MALATTCPSCKTSFKVRSDQLKRRRGMVRCGICELVFSGVEYLRYVSDARTDEATADAANPETVAADLNTAFFMPETQTVQSSAPSRASAPRLSKPRRSQRRGPPPAGSPDWPGLPDDSLVWANHQPDDEVSNKPKDDVRAGENADSDLRAALADDDEWPSTMVWPRPPDPYEDEPVDAPESAEIMVDKGFDTRDPSRPFPRHAPNPSAMRYPEPPLAANDHTLDSESNRQDVFDDDDGVDFFGNSANPAIDFDLPSRGVWLAAGVLALLLTLQVAIGARDVIASSLPATRGLLETISSPFGLKVEMPIRPEAITIESFDLARAQQGEFSFRLNMLLRNRAAMALRWPSIELTLTDSTGGILVRKALLPEAYLADAEINRTGMAASTEKAIRLTLETSEIIPSGYSAVLFYH